MYLGIGWGQQFNNPLPKGIIPKKGIEGKTGE
jgi:hypothetical protein